MNSFPVKVLHVPAKILHVIDSGGLYGAEMMLLNLAREQIRKGMSVCIASIGENKTDEKAIEIRAGEIGIPVRTFRMRPGPNVSGAIQILKFAQKEHFSIFHSHGYKGNILLGMLPKFFRQIPVITTVHGYTAVAKKGFSKMRAYEWLDRWILPRLDAVVLVNQGMLANPAIRSLNRRNLHIIDNGIAEHIPEQKNVLEPSVAQFCNYPLVVGAIGRLSGEKGFDLLLDAFAGLVHGGIPARLVLIGDGRCRMALREQAKKLKISDHVLMTGFLDNASRYLPLFKTLAIPSLTEGLPIVLLEAMRAGIPVVATRVGGIPQVIENGHSGMLVEPANASALEQNIRSVLTDDTLRQRIGENARNRFLGNYTSEKMADRYAKLYGRLIKARKAD